MSKQKLTILSINTRSGTSQKTGRPYAIHEAQCILQGVVEGVEKIVVGVINLSEELAKSQPGEYLADFSLSPGRGGDSGRLVAQVVSLVPFGQNKAKPITQSATA